MGLLADRGVRAHVLNANAASILGELPVEAAMPQLWVERPEDAGRALALIDEFLRKPAGPPRRCPRCGEENPGSFDLCWSCGAGLESC